MIGGCPRIKEWKGPDFEKIGLNQDTYVKLATNESDGKDTNLYLASLFKISSLVGIFFFISNTHYWNLIKYFKIFIQL